MVPNAGTIGEIGVRKDSEFIVVHAAPYHRMLSGETARISQCTHNSAAEWIYVLLKPTIFLFPAPRFLNPGFRKEREAL